MKNTILLPFVAIILVAMAISDGWGSTTYVIKMAAAFILLVISVVVIIKDIKKKNEGKE